jgi:hypothetical protein
MMQWLLGARIPDGPLQVNDLTLPEALAALLRQKHWRRPVSVEELRSISGIANLEKIEFLSYQRMHAETNALFGLYRDGFGSTYGLTYTSAQNALPDALDITKIVTLAVNDDEEGIALDYSASADKPAVVSGTWIGEGDSARVMWKRIAPDFETFARQIGVLE